MNRGRRILKSLALMHVLVLLPSIEATKLQRLSRYAYRTGIPRAQMNVPLPQFILLIRPDTKLVDEVRVPGYICTERKLASANYGRIAC